MFQQRSRTGGSAIAGHRTTYGAPFNLDKLEAETIFIFKLTLINTHTRLVKSIVDQVKYLLSHLVMTNTLTTCHPKFSKTKASSHWHVDKG